MTIGDDRSFSWDWLLPEDDWPAATKVSSSSKDYTSDLVDLPTVDRVWVWGLER